MVDEQELNNIWSEADSEHVPVTDGMKCVTAVLLSMVIFVINYSLILRIMKK